MALVALLLFMSATHPDKVHPALLTIPFMLIAFAIATLVGSLLKLHGKQRRPYLLGLVIALCPTVLLLLRSIGQLTGRDAVFMALFALAIYLYLHKLFRK